jgi:hypothetical protein
VAFEEEEVEGKWWLQLVERGLTADEKGLEL